MTNRNTKAKAEKADARKEAQKVLMKEYDRKVKELKTSQISVAPEHSKKAYTEAEIYEDYHKNFFNKIQIYRA